MAKVEKADVKLNYDSRKSEWRMAKDDGNAQGPGNYPKLKVNYNDTGEFIFKIQNPKDVTFADPAFLPKKGAENPGDFNGQFDVTGEGTGTLIVKVANANPNGSEYVGGDYVYELKFSNNTVLDPILTNGGCCKPQSSQMLYTYAAGAVVLLALFYFVIRPMLARRSAAAIKDRDRS